MNQNDTTGILLVHLGTPAEPTVPAVRRYLREFLSDKRVLTWPAALRWLLVNLVIVPLRGIRSAHAYQQIWFKEGSPLAVYAQRLEQKLKAKIGSGYMVETAMRYGEPSIASAHEKFLKAGVKKVTVIPLYPQYASSTTGSVIEKVSQIFTKGAVVMPFSFRPSFYGESWYIESVTRQGMKILSQSNDQHILFSFHGLPLSHLEDTEKTGSGKAYCYKTHCLTTAELVAKRCGLLPQNYTVSFQSRVGVQEWIQPYTEPTVIELAKKGVKRLVVFCPSFVTDCLETLEEIEMGVKEKFLAHGGKEFILVPSLNDDDHWVEVLANDLK